jgi:hypothetical protein
MPTAEEAIRASKCAIHLFPEQTHNTSVGRRAGRLYRDWPVAIRGNKFDTTDWALDVWVEPNGEWRWKDEDEFARAQELGVLDADAAARVRAEGEQVIAEKPWPTGWEDWRPPQSWQPLPLPDDWDAS